MVATGRGRQSWGSRLRIGQSESFQHALGPKAVPTCLVPGPPVIRTGGQWPRVWVLVKGGGWGRGLELVGLHMKGEHLPHSLTLPKNRLALGAGEGPSWVSKAPDVNASE